MVTKIFKKDNLILYVIIIIAGIVRYWGIDFCLPSIPDCAFDEKIAVRIAIQFGSGDLNPHFFSWPTLYMYSLFFLYSCYFLLGLAVGEYTSISEFITELAVNPTNFFLINRGFTALLGTATVYIIYKITEHLFDKKTAIVSSLFLGLAYLHVRQSHFGITDIPAVFLIYVSLLFIIKSYKEKTLKNYIKAGIFAGLATSTKYTAILLPASISIVHFINIFNINGNKLKLFLDKRMLFFSLAFLFAFLLGTPFALLDFPHFISDFLYEKKLLETPYGINLGKGWWYHMRHSLFHGLGWPLFFTSLLGILTLIKTDIRKAIILCSFPFIFYFFAGESYVVFVKYILPIIPFLCITGAFFVVSGNEKLEKIFKYPLNKIIIFLMPLLIMAPSTYNIILSDILLSKKDNRLVVSEWIKKNIPTGSSIYQSGLVAGKIYFPPTLKSLETIYKEVISKGDKGRMLKAQIDYFRKENINGYEEWTYDVGLRKFKFRHEEKNVLPEYIIIQESPLVVWSRTPVEIKELLKTSYTLVKSFKVIDMNNKENWFDKQDSLYMPFVGFKNIQRPGPNFYVYTITDRLQ